MVAKAKKPSNWKYIYKLFMDNFFDMDESTWAADNNLDPRKGPKAKQYKILKLLKNRKGLVESLMEATGKSVLVVMEHVSGQRRMNALQKSEGEDEWNLFLGASP